MTGFNVGDDFLYRKVFVAFTDIAERFVIAIGTTLAASDVIPREKSPLGTGKVRQNLAHRRLCIQFNGCRRFGHNTFLTMEQLPAGSRVLIHPQSFDMTKPMDAPFDLQMAHKWFAIETNNATWDLLEKPDRSAEEDHELVHLAHASALHWKKSGGDAANTARASCMVANAHAALGDGHAAIRHAEHCVAVTEANPDLLEDWDLAFAYDALARAHDAAGDSDRAAELKARARELGDRIANPGDKSVFDDWFSK